MTNHIHFVAIPERENSLAVLFGREPGRYAQAFNIRHGRCGHLWQARFHSCPMSPAHLEIGLRYVEANPCRAGLAARAEEYRWSSAAAHLTGAGDRSGVLNLGYWERAGGVQTWSELHGRPEAEGEIDALRRCTYAGRPFGDQDFLSEMERRFQRKWSRREKRSAELAKSA